MLTKNLAICGILITVAWAFSASNLRALSADAYEADNTPAQSVAKPLLNDGAQTHTIHVTTDIDYVHCTVSSGYVYRFATTLLDASMDSYLYLLAADGTTVLAENHDSGAGSGSAIDYQFTATGTNYLLIEHYDLNHGTFTGSTGTYSIAMTTLGPEGTAGTTKWEKQFSGSIYSSPAVGADGKIYLGLSDNRLCAFNPAGSTARVWNAGGPLYSAPAIGADGTIYAGAMDSKLYAFNPDGTTGHVWQAGNVLFSSPAIGLDGTIYIGSFDNKLYGYNPDGSTGHVWTTGNIIFSSPVIGADGSIYVGSFDKNFYGFNPDGTTNHAWKVDEVIQYASAGIDTNGNIYIGTAAGTFYSFNPNGTTNHVWNTVGTIYGSPAIDLNGVIYIGSDKLYAFNPDGTTGRTWSALSYSAPLLGSDGSIYNAGILGLYNFNPNGTTNWDALYSTPVPFGGPALGANGILYSVANNKLVAIYAAGTLARAPWPKFQHDLNNTGKVSPDAPASAVATDGLYNNKVRLQWPLQAYASSYDILRGTVNDLSLAQTCASSVAATNYDDTGATAGTVYYYWVLSRNNSGTSVRGAMDTGWRHSFVSSAAGDYDRDRFGDPAVYNQNNGNWKVILSSGGQYIPVTVSNFLGGIGYTAATADFDGDGKADPAVYEEATGNWTVKFTSADYAPYTAIELLGGQGFSAVAGDVDGDGLADPAIYDEATGTWAVRLSAPYAGETYRVVVFYDLLGAIGCSPILADFDGDRLADPAVYNEATGSWAALLSGADYLYVQAIGLLGGAGFLPVVADYDGDGLADPAVYNPTTGDWKVKFSGGNYNLYIAEGYLAP